MKAHIGVIRGATEREVKSKKFNLCVGVSLGNKWFTKENIKDSILWCLEYTKDKVAVLIADTLHSINYEVRNGLSPEKATDRAINTGNKYEELVKEIISELPKDQQEKIEIVKWEDTKKDPFNTEFIPFFFDEFKTNKDFKNKILEIVNSFIKDEERNFNENEISKLCEYVLLELPELLHGFTYNETYYNCYTYPYDSPLTKMVEDIQQKKLFPEFHDKIAIQKNVFVELKVD